MNKRFEFMVMVVLLMHVQLIMSQNTTADFEGFNLEANEFLNGDDGSGGFQSGNIFLPNSYTANYESWTGWAISSMTDATTEGFGNQYSAITGEGVEGSQTYATTFVLGESIIKMENEAAGGVVDGVYVTNGTYPFFSMLNGDQFAKRFGGETGDDPDFFLLTIKKYNDGVLSDEQIDFYLADYRFEDNSQDYIIDEWTFIDLSILGNMDSLSFSLTSSDVGVYGVNTPSYFCIDNLTTRDEMTSTKDLDRSNLVCYPNPTNKILSISSRETLNQISILDQAGRVVRTLEKKSSEMEIDVEGLRNGIYFLQVRTENNVEIVKFIKIN